MGRTGSGKSTLTLGLLRILELVEEKEGRVEIDGVDVSAIGLHHLRHNVSIIPQDPYLFSGTLRSNVDPYEEHSDQEVKLALQQVTIWDQLKGEDLDDEGRLNYNIQDGGSNFSLG